MRVSELVERLLQCRAGATVTLEFQNSGAVDINTVTDDDDYVALISHSGVVDVNGDEVEMPPTTP